jgi:hypothetical protein
MTTAKELRIWAHTMKQWVAKIDDTKVAESLTRAAAEMERLAEYREVAERQLI